MIPMTKPYQLTWEELEQYNGTSGGKSSNGKLRYYCPIHGGDNQLSFVVNPNNNDHFVCHTCGAWGYLKSECDSQYNWKNNDCVIPSTRQKTLSKHEPILQDPHRSTDLDWKSCFQEPCWADELKAFQEALPNSIGESYLKDRGISLINVAQKYGVGYAKDRHWLGRNWKLGRVVFPLTTPDGQLLSLYGRAVERDDHLFPCNKGDKHDITQGEKGMFNAKALLEDRVFICEAAIDALNLLALGYNACAIIGTGGLRWEWVKSKKIYFALDNDEAGHAAYDKYKHQGFTRGKSVYRVLPSDLGGCKDINEAWKKGLLNVKTLLEDERSNQKPILTDPEEQAKTINNSQRVEPVNPDLWQKETAWFQETYQQNRDILLALATRKMPPGTNVKEMVDSCNDYLNRCLKMLGLYEWVADLYAMVRN